MTQLDADMSWHCLFAGARRHATHHHARQIASGLVGQADSKEGLRGSGTHSPAYGPLREGWHAQTPIPTRRH